ncbi:VOC family protein [Gordonia westfalica]|uniref:Glyoxalase/Bleomycin resistance protein/Dioxygenase superfamily protein n=1 Tax=Gordonia westfalica TaxID=158898 RepID=A0A1H2IMI8_9ACTN|nr:VOC family protein [Gordonia westfalica]SDU45156.1 Glyoxalase/Bleomycin resistance protein/Dioxygenase superfamily protein [Gordonia westfalica]
MTLHRLASVTIGVPNVAQTAEYYDEFGLTPEADGWFSTTDGGRQLRIVETPARRLVAMTIGADHPDDLDRIAHNLSELDIPFRRNASQVTAIEVATEVTVTVDVQPRITQRPVDPTPYNGPGRIDRGTGRAPGVLRDDAIRPRKLGHAVLGSTDHVVTQRFFTHGLGFKISDEVPGLAAFLRCSTDHHNVLVQQSPVNFLHHTSWQVDDVDEVGRGAMRMLEADPDRHVWGLGRHYAGSNFFWYLKDPAGNFSEYYSDMDSIVDDQLWTPEVVEGAKGLFSWGPPPPPSFLAPEDLASLMTGAHSAV